MSKQQPLQGTAPVSPWRAASAAGLGTMIEYYDFQLYGVLAVTLSVLFFQTGNESAALLSTLAVFGGAFLARPLGASFLAGLVTSMAVPLL